jgi:hypothetical protein
MTDKEMQELAQWQSSPSGELFNAIRNLEISLKEIEALMKTRDGYQFLKRSHEELASLTERLQTILYVSRPRELQAAE